MTAPYTQTQTQIASLQPSERSFAAGDIEKLYPEGPESACLARLGLLKATNAQRVGDDGYYLARGLAANTLMNAVSEQFGAEGTMLVDLAGKLDEILADRAYRRFETEVIDRVRPEVIQMARGWQARVGQEDDLDLSGSVALLKPEHGPSGSATRRSSRGLKCFRSGTASRSTSTPTNSSSGAWPLVRPSSG
jgi:hypothetical protein